MKVRRVLSSSTILLCIFLYFTTFSAKYQVLSRLSQQSCDYHILPTVRRTITDPQSTVNAFYTEGFLTRQMELQLSIHRHCLLRITTNTMTVSASVVISIPILVLALQNVLSATNLWLRTTEQLHVIFVQNGVK